MAADFSQERLTETFKSLITLSVEGFRYLALVNGGAVVALLAYLGNVTKNGTPLPDLRVALLLFLGGLAACGAAMLCAYITQLRLLNDLLAGASSNDEKHRSTLRVAIAAFVVSLIAFCLGAFAAVQAFSKTSWTSSAPDTPRAHLHPATPVACCTPTLRTFSEWRALPPFCDPLASEFVE